MSFLSWITGTLGYTAILAAFGLAVAAHFFAPRSWSALAWSVAFVLLGAAFVGQRELTAAERVAHADTKAMHAAVLADIATKAAEAHRRVNAAREQWSREFAALDLRHHQELTHAQSENTRLRTAARAGSVVVRIPGANCPVPAGDLPQATSTGGVVAQAAEIDAELRERVFDHRQALIDAEAQISYLIDYASKCAALEIAE